MKRERRRGRERGGPLLGGCSRVHVADILSAQGQQPGAVAALSGIGIGTQLHETSTRKYPGTGTTTRLSWGPTAIHRSVGHRRRVTPPVSHVSASYGNI